MDILIKKIILAINNPRLIKAKILSIFKRLFFKDKHNNGDIFLISYPKSGRTWLRVILGKTLVDLKNLDKTYEPILTKELFSKFNIGDLVISHDFSVGSSINMRHLRGKKVILLTRDIRDVLVSYYFHMKNRSSEGFDQDFDEFLRSPIYGVNKIIKFYSRWEKISSQVELLHVSYEDLHIKPKTIIKDIFEFIGITKIDKGLIDNAIEFSNFENMRRMEQNNIFKDGGMKFRGSNLNSRKVRIGKVHGYSKVMSKSNEEYVLKKIHDANMHHLLYNHNQT